jgi:hypothetical protein
MISESASLPNRHGENPGEAKGMPPHWAILSVCSEGCTAMEAERINQIAAKLEDLRARIADLRRYL